MSSIKVVAEREYLVHLDANWRDAVESIAGSHNKTLLMVPTELVDLFQMQALAKANLRIVEIPKGELAKSPEFLLKMWEVCGEFG